MTTLRYLGDSLRKKYFMFGDNDFFVIGASIPHSKLHKRQTVLKFHRVRESITSGVVMFTLLPCNAKNVDILSKHWEYK